MEGLKRRWAVSCKRRKPGRKREDKHIYGGCPLDRRRRKSAAKKCAMRCEGRRKRRPCLIRFDLHKIDSRSALRDMLPPKLVLGARDRKTSRQGWRHQYMIPSLAGGDSLRGFLNWDSCGSIWRPDEGLRNRGGKCKTELMKESLKTSGEDIFPRKMIFRLDSRDGAVSFAVLAEPRCWLELVISSIFVSKFSGILVPFLNVFVGFTSR